MYRKNIVSSNPNITHPSTVASSPHTHTDSKNGAASDESAEPERLSSAAAAAAIAGHLPLSGNFANDGFTPGG